MGIKYQVQLNNGVEAFGSGKTITANEVLETADNKFVAHHMHLHNPLIPEDVAAIVLNKFCETAAELMGQGYAIQLLNGSDVMMRIFPDVHLQGDNINLARAQQLVPETTDLTLENAGDLAQRVGVTVRARAQVTQRFTDLLNQTKGSVERVSVVEKPYVSRTDNAGGDNTTPQNPATGGSDSGNGGNE